MEKSKFYILILFVSAQLFGGELQEVPGYSRIRKDNLKKFYSVETDGNLQSFQYSVDQRTGILTVERLTGESRKQFVAYFEEHLLPRYPKFLQDKYNFRYHSPEENQTVTQANTLRAGLQKKVKELNEDFDDAHLQNLLNAVVAELDGNFKAVLDMYREKYPNGIEAALYKLMELDYTTQVTGVNAILAGITPASAFSRKAKKEDIIALETALSQLKTRGKTIQEKRNRNSAEAAGRHTD